MTYQSHQDGDVDSGYDGDKFALCVWLMIQAHVEVMRRTQQEFQVLPKRFFLLLSQITAETLLRGSAGEVIDP